MNILFFEVGQFGKEQSRNLKFKDLQCLLAVPKEAMST